jgi:hypothetical protein
MGDSKMEKGLMKRIIGAGHADQAMLILDVPDEILENAAGSVREKAGAMTLAFCSGIDSCPSSVRA